MSNGDRIPVAHPGRGGGRLGEESAGLVEVPGEQVRFGEHPQCGVAPWAPGGFLGETEGRVGHHRLRAAGAHARPQHGPGRIERGRTGRGLAVEGRGVNDCRPPLPGLCRRSARAAQETLNGLRLPGQGLAVQVVGHVPVLTAATLGEESRQPRRLIPPAIMASLAVVAVYTIGVTALVTNAYPSTSQLSAAAVPLVTIAGIVFTVRRRMSRIKTAILVIGLAVLGYILKDTFVPLPAAPFEWDALAAGITLAAGIVLPLAYPPVRRGIVNSPLLKVGASALLGTADSIPAGVSRGRSG
jgi:hypothetical protein